MTRLNILLSVIAAAGVLPSALIAACGSRTSAPASPSEVQPLAPRPETTSPGMAPAAMVSDAGALTPTVPSAPGPVSHARSTVGIADLPSPDIEAAAMNASGPQLPDPPSLGANPIDPQPVDPQPMPGPEVPQPSDPQPNGIPPKDGGILDDAGMPTLPPLPDAKIPVDGGM